MFEEIKKAMQESSIVKVRVYTFVVLAIISLIYLIIEVATCYKDKTFLVFSIIITLIILLYTFEVLFNFWFYSKFLLFAAFLKGNPRELKKALILLSSIIFIVASFEILFIMDNNFNFDRNFYLKMLAYSLLIVEFVFYMLRYKEVKNKKLIIKEKGNKTEDLIFWILMILLFALVIYVFILYFKAKKIECTYDSECIYYYTELFSDKLCEHCSAENDNVICIDQKEASRIYEEKEEELLKIFEAKYVTPLLCSKCSYTPNYQCRCIDNKCIKQKK